MSAEQRTTVEIEGRVLSLSNLEKMMYPSTGFTKADLIAYYLEVGPVMLSHLEDRPLTMRRFPNGVQGGSFYEKHAPARPPEWIRVEHVTSTSRSKEVVDYVVVSELAALVWTANLAAIELHVPMWKLAHRNGAPYADLMVFDLDPGPGTDLVQCCEVALMLEAALGAAKLSARPKTSGKKGLQVYVRLPSPKPWQDVLADAHALARTIEAEHDNLVVTNMRKELRQGRVLIDWSQNNAAKTTIAPYSLRAEETPTISTPITWEEVSRCHEQADPEMLRFLPADVLARVEAQGDLLA